jgi:hypothetical protein
MRRVVLVQQINQCQFLACKSSSVTDALLTSGTFFPWPRKPPISPLAVRRDKIAA